MKWVASMHELLMNWSLAKIAYSVVLLAVVWFFLGELYRVWVDRQLYISVPVHFADGKVDATRDTAFGGLVLAHHHRMVVDLKSEADKLEKGSKGGRNDSVKKEKLESYDRLSGLPQQGPRLPAASQQLDLKISGFDVGALLSQLRQWVSPRNEASVTVEARSTGSTAGLVEAVVSWPEAPSAAINTAGSLRYFSSTRMPSDDSAASVVAAKFLWSDLTKGDGSKANIPLDEFVPWIRAWNKYKPVRDDGRAPGNLRKEETELLEQAGMEIQPLLDGKKPAFVEVWRLAANMLALHPTCIPSNPFGYDHYKDLYLVSVGKLPPGTRVTSATTAAAAQAVAVAVDVGPGSLIWSANVQTAVKVTAVVKDAAGVRYLLTSALLAVDGQTPASVLFGGGPQDRKPIATISKLIELQPGGPAVALARLEAGATAGNGALKKIADEPNLGEELKMIGQPKSGKVRTIRLDTQDFGKGLIAVAPKVTGPGDAGAPFVDAEGQLQAMGYAGSDESSILIPLPELLNHEKLSLD